MRPAYFKGLYIPTPALKDYFNNFWNHSARWLVCTLHLSVSNDATSERIRLIGDDSKDVTASFRLLRL